MAEPELWHCYCCILVGLLWLPGSLAGEQTCDLFARAWAAFRGLFI